MGGTAGPVTGDTSSPFIPAGGRATATPPECQEVQACYAQLSDDLCIDSDPTCTSAFTVRRSISNRERCAAMLDRAESLAMIFAAGRSAYTLPQACRR